MRHVIWNPTLGGEAIHTYADLLEYEKSNGGMSTELVGFTHEQMSQIVYMCEQECNAEMMFRPIAEPDPFKEAIYEIAFGDMAINKYTDKEVIHKLEQFSDDGLKYGKIMELMKGE